MCFFKGLLGIVLRHRWQDSIVASHPLQRLPHYICRLLGYLSLGTHIIATADFCCISMAAIVCMQVVAFEKAGLLRAKGDKECRREADRSKAFADAITHTVSLLHAVCLQHLRGDWDLSNLCSHDPDGAPPPTVSRPIFKFHGPFAMRCASFDGPS